jgi:hypothetical protein
MVKGSNGSGAHRIAAAVAARGSRGEDA